VDIKKIALIEPSADAECLTTEIFAQIRSSLPFLAGALRSEGFRCAVYCDELIKLTPRIEKIVNSYDAAGISVTINTVSRAVEIAEAIKKINPSFPIIFGGHVAGNFADKLLKYGDYCLIGRSEVTLPFLLKTIGERGDPNAVANLCFRCGNRIVRTKRSDMVSDHASDFGSVINLGGFSELRNFLGFKKPPLYSIFTSTGCVRNCAFCVTERKYATRGVKNVVSDLESILALHRGFLPPRIMIVDDCAFGDREYLKALLKKIAEVQRKKNFSMMLQFHVRPLLDDAEIAPLLMEAGVGTLLMGFESASDESLAHERKGTTVADNVSAIEKCRGHGIIPYGYFVAGFDTDTADSVRNTFDFIIEHKLVAQVLPMGVMEIDQDGKKIAGSFATLDPYSFGATIFVSHKPARMKPYELQLALIEGYDKIYSKKRIFSFLTMREKIYHAFFCAVYKKWRPKLERHLNYLKLLDKFSGSV